MSETLFKEVRYDLGSLVKFIELGEIGLPDIQRPFVWKNVKVRNLFDSMYQGYPIGYLLFWQNAITDDSRAIGTDQKQKVPRLLIVDGQQRLTAIYAVLKGIPVVRDNYSSEHIEIAFNPLQGKFEVADAAIRRDKSYISNISVLWSDDTDLFEVVDEYLVGLGSAREVSDSERKLVRKAITKLQTLLSFPFTALELSETVGEEQVADVFVRINSEGKPLNQADFILTLMSVFWDEGRAELEKFCREARSPSSGEACPFNHYIEPDPDQLLRVAVGLGFKRARLQYVYSILRGKDLNTEEFSEERRVQQFEVLKQAQQRVLNLQYWHDFFKAIMQAGYRSKKMITSQNNLLFAYILYLMGRTEYHVDEYTLRRVIARWFFMSSLTGRYTGSPESRMEFDLARFREIQDADGFVKALERVCDEKFTADFWTVTLPNELATSSARSPTLFAYYSALNLLDARVLYSKHKVSELLDPVTHGKRSALERHHLFAKGHLKTLGITSLRDTNQIANFAPVEWGDNTSISNQSPAEYVPEYDKRLSDAERKDMHYWHALPEDWHTLEYRPFLERRREMIAEVIRDACTKLSIAEHPAEEIPEPISVADLVKGGETADVEFKSTLRINLHTGQKDPRMELGCIKTIAGFLNAHGGTLVIGVADDGEPIGIEEDKFPNEDKMNLHLVNLIRDRIGPQHMMSIHHRFDDYNSTRVLTVECSPAKAPIFVKDGNVERFYVRTGASTTELTASQTQDFIQLHFNK